MEGGDWSALMLGFEIRQDIHRRSHSLQPFLIAGLGVARIDIRDLSFDGTIYDDWLEWGLVPRRGTRQTCAYFSGGGGFRLDPGDLTLRFVYLTPESGTFYIIPLTLSFHF